MQIEVVEPKPVVVVPPKEYILRINQAELDLIAALVGRTCGGPNWVRPLYSGLENYMTIESEDILVDKDDLGRYNYASISLKND